MKVKLGSLGDIFIGLTYKPEDVSDEGTIVLRSSNIQNGKLDFEDIVRVQKKINEKLFVRDGDILMCSRNGSAKLVGKTAMIKDLSEAMTFGAFMTIIRTDKNSYLQYFFKSDSFRRQLKGSATTTINQITRNMLLDVDVPLLTEDESVDIVNRMERIENIIDMRKQELQRLDVLIKARFVELFGDMLLNDRGWKESILEEIADLVSGITKGRKVKDTELIEVPYMAVSNVKDGYIDWTTVKTIFATKNEIDQYRLLPNDVLMTEGGDPDKVGRGAIIREPMENSIHQNHIFRVRLDREIILPEYFSEYLQHQKAKRYFLRCAKQTTGIASINMRQLRSLPVLTPPMELQQQFATFVEQTDKSKVAVQKALDEAQLLFDSLMQKYFG